MTDLPSTNASSQVPTPNTGPLRVPAGEDRFGEHRGLGFNLIQFKLCPQDSGGVLIVEITTSTRGGPERHLHREQDEWFYPIEGEYVIEVGQERYSLKPGDSVLAPRMTPHVWANVGPSRGRMLILFNPAGSMEDFFRQAARANRMPGPDPDLWRSHGMEWLGPPLAV